MSLQRFARRELVTVSADRAIVDVARLMQNRHVGSVIVVQDGRPIGIVTDRDLVVRVIAEGWQASRMIGEVMTTDLVTAHVDDSLDHAFYLLRHHGVRRLPLVRDDGTLVGLLAVDDLIVLLSGEVSSVAETVLENRGP